MRTPPEPRSSGWSATWSRTDPVRVRPYAGCTISRPPVRCGSSGATPTATRPPASSRRTCWGLDPLSHPDKDSQVREARAASTWTWQAVEDAGCFTWLAGLPAEMRLSLPDGTGVLLVHAAPGTDDGPGLFAEQSDEEVRAAGVAAAGAQGVGLVVVGHTHVPMDRTVDLVRVVNLGSVSVPVTPDPRAMWTLLTADQDGVVSRAPSDGVRPRPGDRRPARRRSPLSGLAGFEDGSGAHYTVTVLTWCRYDIIVMSCSLLPAPATPPSP